MLQNNYNRKKIFKKEKLVNKLLDFHDSILTPIQKKMYICCEVFNSEFTHVRTIKEFNCN